MAIMAMAAMDMVMAAGIVNNGRGGRPPAARRRPFSFLFGFQTFGVGRNGEGWSADLGPALHAEIWPGATPGRQAVPSLHRFMHNRRR
jgi:hypothetical protein